MRLSTEQVGAIVSATRALAGDDAQVRLFGSRLDDSQQGGDIDLLVSCPRTVDNAVWLGARIQALLQRKLGERRIDVLVLDQSTALQPVHRVALAQGQLLAA